MESYKDFQNSFNKYSKYEDILAHKLIEKYDLNSYEKCTTKAYDIKLSNNQTYELKVDMMSNRTKNVYVEYWSRGKQSGIYTTKSDYYVFSFDCKTFHIIKSSKLLNIVKVGNYRKIETKHSSTFGYLIPMSEFMSYVDETM